MSEVYEEVSFGKWGTKSTQYFIKVGGVHYRAGEVREPEGGRPMLILDGLVSSQDDYPEWLFESLNAFHGGQRLAVKKYKESMGVYLGR